jgi:hypothetical protein
MAKLIYSALASLDGYVEDERGAFDWAAPDDDVHAFVNDLERASLASAEQHVVWIAHGETMDLVGAEAGVEHPLRHQRQTRLRIRALRLPEIR